MDSDTIISKAYTREIFMKNERVILQKGLKFIAISSFLGVFIGGIIVEIMLRVLGIGYGNSPMVSSTYLHHVRPSNYSFLQSHPSGEFGGFMVTYDSQGLRVGENKIESNSTLSYRYRVAFMGDSFLEGHTVSFEDSFFGILTKAAGKNSILKNFGVSSYSPAIQYLQYKTIVREFSPTDVILLLYSNDVEDDKRYTHKGIFNSNGNLISIPGPEHRVIIKFLRNFYIFRFIRKLQLKIKYIWNKTENIPSQKIGSYLEMSPNISKTTENYLLAISNMTKIDGARFYLLAVPSKYKLQSDDPDLSFLSFSDKVKKWAEGNDINYIDLYNPFLKNSNKKKLFYDKDIHFSPFGHKITAEVIKENFINIF